MVALNIPEPKIVDGATGELAQQWRDNYVLPLTYQLSKVLCSVKAQGSGGGSVGGGSLLCPWIMHSPSFYSIFWYPEHSECFAVRTSFTSSLVRIRTINLLPCVFQPGRPDVQQLLKCGACRFARYCDKDCQKKAWQSHKQECTAVKRMSPRKSDDQTRLVARILWRKEKKENIDDVVQIEVGLMNAITRLLGVIL